MNITISAKCERVYNPLNNSLKSNRQSVSLYIEKLILYLYIEKSLYIEPRQAPLMAVKPKGIVHYDLLTFYYTNTLLIFSIAQDTRQMDTCIQSTLKVHYTQ